MSAAPDLPPARALRRAPLGVLPYDIVVLRHDERLLRRRRLVTAHDEGFLVDLPATSGLDQGDALELEDGRLIEVIAAEEPLLEVRGPDLPRLAWHLGNRHAPCRIEADRLLIQRDHVLRDMLGRLGAEVREVSEPFVPEGGAYGHGRTMGHDHYSGDLGQLSSHVPGHGG
ncbi:Urease accessory protein UreE [Rubellimicrobium mesophilum DSM 19309]|uniref:Urease accessory protein UreE n=1 Tax=Rubellimicrobium mesophilum DSM 19309 TaxID=442562 RepID=A0A017HGK1_9RHOB|nr:urease accessory protein UreE [Rubellimicrobium mesophilum]EYD72929.1 Urease accessory protein UreE [Rubellimicrobium mesophilum DSM 19309]